VPPVPAVPAVPAAPATPRSACWDDTAGSTETRRGVAAVAAGSPVSARPSVAAAAARGQDGQRAGEAAEDDLGGLRGASGAPPPARAAGRSRGPVGAVHAVTGRLTEGEPDHRRHAPGPDPGPAGRSGGARRAGPAVSRATAMVHRMRGGQHAELIARSVPGRGLMQQVLAPEDQQVALHDDATAGLDQQFAQVHDGQDVVPLVHAELGAGHGEIPHLARGDPAGQDAQKPGGERQLGREPGPVSVIDVPVGERVGLAAVVHALAEAAAGGHGRVEELRLARPPFGRADEAEPPDVVDGGQADE
jgi:hypothetical protein